MAVKKLVQIVHAPPKDPGADSFLFGLADDGSLWVTSLTGGDLKWTQAPTPEFPKPAYSLT